MTKAQKRQRAYYRKMLAAWTRGEFTPAPGWAQMVCDRFPDLVDEVRERMLGREAAQAARDEYVRKSTPKVGEVFVAPSGLRVVVTDIVGNKLTVARATRFNRFVVRLRQLFRLLVGAFTPARS